MGAELQAYHATLLNFIVLCLEGRYYTSTVLFRQQVFSIKLLWLAAEQLMF